MRKNDKKQRRSLLFSTGIVVAGCLVTGLYVNQSMNTTEDYSLDLSRLNTSESADSDFTGEAGAARVNGSDVVNPVIDTNDNDSDGNGFGEGDSKGDNVKGDNVNGNNGNANGNNGKENNNGSVPPQSDETVMTEEKSDKSESGSSEKEETKEINETTETFNLSFSSEDGMTWPVRGDVILNYSMDSAVYFSTLEQYKYNPAIYIGAGQGDTVSACAKGKVTKIGKDDEIGNYVIMSVGNGYEVTCGQLEDLQVKEGDMVSRGQVIGSVAKTTKYYAVEGDHVYLKITKDGEAVNPLELLQ